MENTIDFVSTTDVVDISDVYDLLLQILYCTKYLYFFACGFAIYFIIKILYNFFADFIFGGV